VDIVGLQVDIKVLVKDKLEGIIVTIEDKIAIVVGMPKVPGRILDFHIMEAIGSHLGGIH
jgi:hypothetical protein